MKMWSYIYGFADSDLNVFEIWKFKILRGAALDNFVGKGKF